MEPPRGDDQEKKKGIGLVPKLLIAIALGIAFGLYAPEFFNRCVVSALFSSFLMFVIPLMILAFVTIGIADLSQGAGKLLGVTAAISYGSTLLAGSIAYIVAINFFPSFITHSVAESIGDPEAGMLRPFFTIPLTPLLDVTAAVAFAFILGICISAMRGKKGGAAIYGVLSDLSDIVNMVLQGAIFFPSTSAAPSSI